MPNRNIAPRITPLSTPSLLPYQCLIWANGTEIFYLNDPLQEVFKIDVVFEAGIYYQSQPLVASTTVNMLNEGTLHHSAEAIADQFDYYGAYVDFSCGLNKTEVSLLSLNKYATETLTMLAEIITESNIPDKELEIYLTNKRQEYLVNLEKTSYLAKQKFSALIFGEDHPYANRIEESDYQRITVSLIRDFYHRYYQAGQFRIFICGHVNEGLLNTVTRLFGNLPIPSPGNISKKLPFHAAQPGRYHVSKENCVQSSIRIGKSSVRLTDDDYAGYMLLNTILGGYFGSRLMSNIREEKGYTYGIGSFNVSLPQRSYWSITTEVNNEYTEATIEEIFKEIHKLRTETVPAEELNLVKNYLYGDLLRELDGVFAQSDSLKHKLNYGLDNSFYIGIIEKIRQCTPEAILELADKYWIPEEMYIVTAGQP